MSRPKILSLKDLKLSRSRHTRNLRSQIPYVSQTNDKTVTNFYRSNSKNTNNVSNSPVK